MPDLEILTRKVTPAIVTGAGSPVSSAIVVSHESQRKLFRHDLIDSFVFRHDVLEKMGEDIRAAVNFWRRLVLRQVRNSITAKARDFVLIDDVRFRFGVRLLTRWHEKTFKVAHEIKFLRVLFIVIFVS